PRNAGRLTTAAWEAEPGAVVDTIAAVQTRLGAWVWRPDVVIGAIAVAALCAAAAAALMTSALRRSGLPASASALLALVAAAAPFASWSGSSPLGAAPVTLASIVVLTRLSRPLGGRGNHQPGSTKAMPLVPPGRVTLLLVL